MSAQAVPFSSTLADFASLTKPRLSSLVVCTAAGGMWLAPGSLPARQTLLVILATAGIVGAANAFNCYWERDSDRFMKRTRNRPLPAGRMEPSTALWFGGALLAVSLPALTLASNLLTGFLGLLAFVSYVFVYTPLKARSWTAMLVGGLPGALPPLMGWTAITGRITGAGVVLFAILFLWQIPHFIAIALFRKEEYAAAGLKSLPLERGDEISRAMIVRYLVFLVPVSILPFAMGLSGWIYLTAAVLLGATFLGYGVYGFVKKLGQVWARKLFLISLLYLTGLFIALMVDVRVP
ncbi:MAG: heme o synthase [Myxococcota bacterium]|nr:heme o synthase [Myxococcota bacterium]